MKFFIKLNTLSALYALALFIAIELIINVSRFSDITGWDWDRVYFVIAVINVLGLLLATVIFISLTRKWMIGSKHSFWTFILWLPYFMLLFALIRALLPLQFGDTLFPRYSLLIIGSSLLFPVYILFINLYASPLRIEEEDGSERRF